MKKMKPKKTELFVRSMLVEGDRVDGNGDYFSYKVLKKSYKTFIGKPVVRSYGDNTRVGKIVDSMLNSKTRAVNIVAKLFKNKILKIPEGLWLGYSFKVNTVTCSKCGRKYGSVDMKCNCATNHVVCNDVELEHVALCDKSIKRA